MKRPVELQPCLQVVQRVATERVSYTVDRACKKSDLPLALWRGASFEVRHWLQPLVHPLPRGASAKSETFRQGGTVRTEHQVRNP